MPSSCLFVDLNRSYPATVLRPPAREEACAIATDRAALALLDGRVLPIRDRLHREGPDAGVEHAERQVVDRDVDPSCGENVNAGRQLFLIVQRINPKDVVVGDGKAGVFQAHQRNVIHER